MSDNTIQDVIIIGGGPAGSALGCYLSKAGIKNTIFEAANHPRPHVGESMVMSQRPNRCSLTAAGGVSTVWVARARASRSAEWRNIRCSGLK